MNPLNPAKYAPLMPYIDRELPSTPPTAAIPYSHYGSPGRVFAFTVK
jgi:hypothetical protein